MGSENNTVLLATKDCVDIQSAKCESTLHFS